MKKLLPLLLCIPLLLSCGGEENIEITETEFLNKVENNEVSSVTFVTNAGYAEVEIDNNINNTPSLNFRYSDIKDVIEQIRLRNLEGRQILINYKEESRMYVEILGWIFPLIFFIGIWVVIIVVIILIIRYFRRTNLMNKTLLETMRRLEDKIDKLR